MGQNGPIGIFDSGYGGLTILKEIVKELPGFDYIYLGDNARTPYGTRSFETVYQFTLECVEQLFSFGCPLVILACNTASAKALRTIQQNDLQKMAPGNRVLGVIRPTSETIGNYSATKKIGILATTGTVQSKSYEIEIHKFFPEVKVFQQGCPMWVPLIENNEHESPGADYFVQKYIENLLNQDKGIDTILLACTHYLLLENKIRKFIPDRIQLISQGEIVAGSLKDYLQRHPEIEKRCTTGSGLRFYTTDSALDFNNQANLFFKQPVQSKKLNIIKNG
jgi:glutamate racemase